MIKVQPFQERVVKEKEELDEKIIKLDAFLDIEIFKNLSEDEQTRLKQQLTVMKEYSDILEERIRHFQ